jgi:hypothetical protein
MVEHSMHFAFDRRCVMKKLAIVQVLSFAAVVLVGCGGADDGGTGGSASNPTKAGKQTGKAPTPSGTASSSDPTSPGPDSPAVECVPAGTKGNALGVGAYCQAASDCTNGTFCTAGFAPKGAEFCTLFCTTDADCGEGNSCYTDPRGKACAPSACLATK